VPQREDDAGDECRAWGARCLSNTPRMAVKPGHPHYLGKGFPDRAPRVSHIFAKQDDFSASDEVYMRPGRKPKPFLLKLAEGNRGRRKLIPGVELPAGPFDPPFPLDGIALQEWERIIAAAYWLRETDAVAVADRCLCFQRMLECEQDVRDRGVLTRTRAGKVTNPSVRIARGYRTSIQRHDAELGLTASSRSRVSDDAQGPSSPGYVDPLERKLCGEEPPWGWNISRKMQRNKLEDSKQ
jgi:P27 family predicted phage terminase small subunit